MFLRSFATLLIALLFVFPLVAQDQQCDPEKSWTQVVSKENWTVDFDKLVQKKELNQKYAEYIQKASAVKALAGQQAAKFVIWHNTCTTRNNVEFQPAVGKQVMQQYDAGETPMQVQGGQNAVVVNRYTKKQNALRVAAFGGGIAISLISGGLAGYVIGGGIAAGADRFIQPKPLIVQPEWEQPKQDKDKRNKRMTPEDETEGVELAALDYENHRERIRAQAKNWY